ncbi:MAG: tetratricopeptide repeat protein [Tepidisphaeraceae bacterium]
MKKFCIILSVLTLIVAGCSNDKPEPTGRDKLHTQWNNARAGVLYGLAKQQFEGGNVAEARKSLDEAIRLQSDNVSLRILSARVSIEQGKLESAVKELDNVRAIDPNNAEADYLMGVIYQRWQKPENALKWYVRASEKNPAELAYAMARAETLVSQNRGDEALDYLQQRLAYFENASPIRVLAGQLLLWSGKRAEAVTMFREASILTPEDEQIREHLALALYRNGQYAEAITVIERLTRNERFAGRADLLLALGESLLGANRPEDARGIFQNLAQNQPAEPHIWLVLAKAGLACNDTERAEMSIRKAIALDANSVDASVLMGYLRIRQGRLDDAQAAFQKAAALDPTDAVAVCMSGYVLEKQGKTRQAMDLYVKALRLKPKDELASTLLAQVRAED